MQKRNNRVEVILTDEQMFKLKQLQERNKALGRPSNLSDLLKQGLYFLDQYVGEIENNQCIGRYNYQTGTWTVKDNTESKF